MRRVRVGWVILLGLTPAAFGCGSGQVKLPVARTEGRVVCEGQPVPFATVFFEPLPVDKNALAGKQAVGYADEQGNFTLTTYDQNDGAVIGKHRVRVGPPLGDAAKADYQCDCALNPFVDVMEVTIESGRNNIEVRLKKASAEELATAKKVAQASNAEVDD
jgi:hypothetical protein